MYFEAIIEPGLVRLSPELAEPMAKFSGEQIRTFLITFFVAVGLFGGGFFVFGVAMYKAAVMPRWAVVLFVVGSVVGGPQGFLPVAVATVAFLTMGVGLAGLGVALGRTPRHSNLIRQPRGEWQRSPEFRGRFGSLPAPDEVPSRRALAGKAVPANTGRTLGVSLDNASTVWMTDPTAHTPRVTEPAPERRFCGENAHVSGRAPYPHVSALAWASCGRGRMARATFEFSHPCQQSVDNPVSPELEAQIPLPVRCGSSRFR
jgi:hypothetical protein